MTLTTLSLEEERVAQRQEHSTLQGARLLMVAHSVSTHTHRWAHYFQDQGMRVTVVSPFDHPIDNVPVRLFPARKAWYQGIPRLHLYIDYVEWKSMLRSVKPDIVHVHYLDGGFRNHFYYNNVERLISSAWGSDVCESNEFPLPRRHKQGVRALLQRSNVVTATTHFLGAVTARYCAPGTPIHIIPFGVDCERFRPGLIKRDDDEVRIGFTKNLESKYGPEVLIEAFGTIVKHCPRARLIMCGKGEMAGELQARAAQMGLSNRISFPGRLPHDQIVPLMQSLDLMVMPSTCQESFGVAAIEASACQVPVVATQVGGVPEAVEDGRTGLLVPPFDPDALARACIDLIDDPERRRRMGIAGREFVLARYPWRANAATMASVYEQMLAGGKVTTPEMMVAG
jgi:glycosyltransferase involved in cell wall biosynthesis